MSLIDATALLMNKRPLRVDGVDWFAIEKRRKRLKAAIAALEGV